MLTWGERLGEGVIRFRWPILVVTLLLVATASAGLRLLTFANDSRIFFSAENPQLQALEELENTFSKEDNLLFTLAPAGGTVFTPEVLAAVAWLTEESWQLPYSSRVSSLTNFQHTRAEADELVVEDLVAEPEQLTEANCLRIAEIALAEPLLVNRVVSPSGHVTGVDVLVTKPGKAMSETNEVTVAARQLADRFRRRYPDIALYLTGGVVIDNAFAEASQEDMATLVPAMYVVLLVILAFALRSVSGTVATLLVIVSAMLTAMGVTGWLGIALSPPTVNAPTIILTLAVADSVHILISMVHFMAQGMAKRRAIAHALGVNLQAVTITSLTTAVGFLSMNYSDAPPFRDLGNIVALGVAAAWLYSIIFLPAFMAVVPVSVGDGGKKESRYRWCDGLAEWILRHRRRLFWGITVGSLLVTAGMLRIELNDDFVKYFDTRYDFRVATDFTEAELTGFNVIEYKLPAAGAGGINDPAYLATVDRFADWYRRQQKVVHVWAIADIMKRLNKNMHGDDPAWYRLPDRRELAAQYLLLFEMSLPFGHDLNNMINVDKSATRMVVRVRNMSSREIQDTDARAQQWLRDNAPEMRALGSGLSIMFAYISERNIRSMLTASFGALVLISGVLMVALRNVRIGSISIIPNLTPALMAFGIWGLLVGEVGLVVSVLAALTLGIVVDDTVHFLSKYLHARRELGKGPEDSVRYAFHTVGTALWVTTVVLVAGFLVLTLSGFQLNAHMGLMTAMTITLALAMDFFYLPPLVLLIDKEG